MNTVDATPQLSLGEDCTVVVSHYAFVNSTVRTDTPARKTATTVIYGKQNITGAQCLRAMRRTGNCDVQPLPTRQSSAHAKSSFERRPESGYDVPGRGMPPVKRSRGTVSAEPPFTLP
jgi:hypothetical protein